MRREFCCSAGSFTLRGIVAKWILHPPWGCAQWGGLQPANPSEARTLLLLSSAVFWVRDIEVDERETPIGAATGVPSGSGAFAGHTLSQRSLTGCPLGPALPEIRCTPGFSRLARTSVNRLTFKSRTLSCASALCFCLVLLLAPHLESRYAYARSPITSIECANDQSRPIVPL